MRPQQIIIHSSVLILLKLFYYFQFGIDLEDQRKKSVPILAPVDGPDLFSARPQLEK